MSETLDPAHAEPADAEALAPDYALNPDFVRAVADAAEAGDAAEARRLVDELHPADIADLLGLLRPDERRVLVQALGEDLNPDILPELDEDVIESVVDALQPTQLADAVAQLETDDAVAVIEDLEPERIEEILSGVPEPERLAVQTALDYEEDCAGRIMQREFFSAPGYWTVGQIIDHMRGADNLPDRLFEVFVVDTAFKPIGYVGLARILKTRREVKLETIMEPQNQLIPATMDQEEVGYLFEQYNLISAPVVDAAERLVGMITVDDIVHVVHAESNEDMLALGGVREDGLSDNVFVTVRRRFSWLLVNLMTAVLASIVIALFDEEIETLVALAVLMPIIASMGGNAGTQTLTVAVRALAMKDLTASNAARLIGREALVGGVNGLLFAIIMGLFAGLWFQSGALGMVVAGAMIINLLCAGLAGILVPLSLQKAGADPALASTVFVTTVTDVVGFFVFLGLAATVLF